jgi:RNA polymerase sigma factor (sigma-70 family)
MQAMDDMALLREYAAGNSEAAFETLVLRRVDFVYSMALRQVRDPHLAEEVTQAVFIILAQKAGRISGQTILAGWLFRTTRFAALAQMRADAKRRRREQEANMQSEIQPTAPDLFWEQMSPLLDEALATLGETDRQAVLLRFFENKSLAEVGHSLGTGEDTARKRVSRALEKLHRYFSKHGISSTTDALAGAISANSVQAAPAMLANSVTAVAIAKGAAASGSTLTLIKGALKIMAWTKAKTAIIAGTAVILAAGTAAVVIKTAHSGHNTPEIPARLKAFIVEKEAQIRAKGKDVSVFKPFVEAADRSDWLAVSNTFQDLANHAGQYEHSGKTDERLHGTAWEAVKEIWGGYEAFSVGDEKYSTMFGDDIIDSIPAGSIYFGGTDQGRFIVTALCKSQIKAEPFFTVTQNALADDTYLEYLRGMYGEMIYVPTAEDSQKSIEDYKQDAAQRQSKNQLGPGENVRRDANGKIQVSGQVAVMNINGLLAKIIFDKNPGREFYIEESFPLDWMKPYLEPHGLIMKINRQPLSELSDEIVERDHDYWMSHIRPMIGDWLHDDTSVGEVAAFAQKTFGKQDFSGFTGDPRFIQNAYSYGMFSMLRSSIAGIYMWRLDHAASEAEKERMTRATDFAFRQAWALCPTSPEAVFRYTNFLLKQNRNSDARLVASTCLKLDPNNVQVKNLVSQLQQLRGTK